MTAVPYADIAGMATDSIVPTGLPTRFVARQSIVDARQRIFGYELLFRDGWENRCPQVVPEDAGEQTLETSLLIGMEELTQGRPAFVNCTRRTLVDSTATLLPPESTVLEVLESIDPDDEVIGALHRLKDLGYSIALDDFQPSEKMQPLVDLSDYVKVDFRITSQEARAQIAQMTKGRRTALLAEKVEDQGEFSWALHAGYQYFQGYLFSKPVVTGHHEIPSNQVNMLRMLGAISRSPLDYDEVEQILQLETSLSYRLLRMVNTTVYAQSRHVESIRTALIMIGEEQFRKLAMIAMVSQLGMKMPAELMVRSLERARFCEQMALRMELSPSEMFLAGAFSQLDIMLQIPMQDVLGRLPLRVEVKDALLGYSNKVFELVQLFDAYESGNWKHCMEAAERIGVTEEQLTEVYLAAVRYVAANIR